MALPVMTQSSWCSPSNPQGSCSPVSVLGGPVCKPMNASTLGVYQGLQRQLNRVLYAAKKSTLSVDGRIGPSTVKAINDTSKYHGMAFPNCDAVAAAAMSVEAQLLQTATKMNAPGKVPTPKPSAPSVPRPDGGVNHPSWFGLQVAGFGDFITSPLGIAVAVASGVALWQISKYTKKKSTKGWF